jgi:hypothetical protein
MKFRRCIFATYPADVDITTESIIGGELAGQEDPNLLIIRRIGPDDDQ